VTTPIVALVPDCEDRAPQADTVTSATKATNQMGGRDQTVESIATSRRSSRLAHPDNTTSATLCLVTS
jgi:hypothetical protein